MNYLYICLLYVLTGILDDKEENNKMQSIANELDTKESVTKLPRNKKSAPSNQLICSNNEIGRQQKSL